MQKIDRALFNQIVLVTAAYFFAGRLGLLVPYIGTQITLIWLPTGIAIAAVSRWGYRCWPGIFLGAFLVNASVGGGIALALCIAIGNTLAPVLSTKLLTYFKFNQKLVHMRDVIIMIVAACFGMLISASGGILSLKYYGQISHDNLAPAWLIWWVGDIVGVLLIFPILINLSKSNSYDLWQQRNVYFFWCVLVAALEVGIFKFIPNAASQFALLAFLVLPLVIWTAMRFRINGGLLAVLGLSIIAVLATVDAYGPFYQPDLQQGLLSLWAFMSSLVLVVLMITVMQSERLDAEAELRKSETKLRAVVDGALEGIITIDENGCLVEFNSAAERMLGYTRNQVIGKPIAEIMIPPSQRDAHIKGHQHYINSGEKRIFDKRLEMMAMRSDGSEFPVELALTSLHEKGLRLVTGFVRDITNRKKAEEEIRNLAFFEVLTGLPNRRLLIDHLQQAFAASMRTQNRGAVLFIDLDNFKSINDARGHGVGDLLLIEVAKRLKNSTRAEDTVARLGGDEFVVLIENLSTDLAQAIIESKSVCENIIQAINQPYWLKDLEHHHTCSIGVSLFLGDHNNVDELLKRADTAMYQAKASGRNTLRFYDPEMQQIIESRVKMEGQLRQALAQNQFCLHYQIQVDHRRNIFGAEVLLRWNRPAYGLTPPVEFIPIAEECGLIVPIGRWVLQCACEQLKAWQSIDYMQNLQLAVNVSARQFRQEYFVQEVKDIIEKTGVNPKLLKLELTESIIIENIHDAIEKMQALQAIGIDFSMDDFGTGYSSLAYLKKLPITQVKIDKSFVNDITIDASDAAIVKTIIVMSSTLGLNVIAEGVETQEQLNLLEEYGCKRFQGYLFSRPVVLKELETLLKFPNSISV